MHSAEVIPIGVKPKTIKRTYKTIKYTVTFIPRTKQWKWRVETTQTLVYEDVAPTEVKAFRAAETFIDQVKK